MAKKVNPDLLKDIKKYGSFDISLCFNCGNCTAICPLSKEDMSFPRKMIRYAQIGDIKSIESSLEPWMCYYCGECSQTCPREAYPGEFMMSLRRYLISRYDFTGISRLFYLKPILQNVLVIFVFVISFIYFLKYEGDFQDLASKIEFFFPIYVTVSIVGYMLTMYRKTIFDKAKRIIYSFSKKSIKETLIKSLIQKDFLSCSEADKIRWLSHILVMSAYILTLIISNLHIFEPLKKQYQMIHPVSLLVLYASGGIIVGGFIMMYRRVLKRVQSSKFSHSSDWLFVIMLILISSTLFLTLTSNIFLGPFHHLTEFIYKLNIAVEISWILVVVPFTKWIHMLFRPFAIYLREVKLEKKLVED